MPYIKGGVGKENWGYVPIKLIEGEGQEQRGPGYQGHGEDGTASVSGVSTIMEKIAV